MSAISSSTRRPLLLTAAAAAVGLTAAVAAVVITIPAFAATSTVYVSPSGAGTACSADQPCALSTAQSTVRSMVGGMSGLMWGFFASTVAVYHSTFLVNSACHLFGYRRFQTTDASRNNWWVALLTFGEGWHNNHHHYPTAARQGFAWWELDISYTVLRLLSQVGLVWDLREPTPRALAKDRITTSAA